MDSDLTLSRERLAPLFSRLIDELRGRLVHRRRGGLEDDTPCGLVDLLATCSSERSPWRYCAADAASNTLRDLEGNNVEAIWQRMPAHAGG